MKGIGLIIGTFCLFVYQSHAQSLMDDLKMVSSVLDTAKAVQINVICKIYSKKGGDLTNTVYTGVTRKGKTSVSILDDVEIFTNEKYGVFIDNEHKSIAVLSKSKHASRLKSIGDEGIDQLVSWMKKHQTKTSFNPVLLSDEEGIRTYSLKNTDDVNEVMISINVIKKCIVKITYEFSESSTQKQKYISLDYSKFLINQKETTINQSDYYIQQSGKILPGNKYKSYSITTDL